MFFHTILHKPRHCNFGIGWGPLVSVKEKDILPCFHPKKPKFWCDGPTTYWCDGQMVKYNSTHTVILVHMVNNALLKSFSYIQQPSHSESSLATGSSEVSLQTMLEEGINFRVPPYRDRSLPHPLLCPVPDETLSSSDLSPRLHPDRTSLTDQATRGHQRSQSSCDGSPRHSCNKLNSIKPLDEDTGSGGGSSQAFNSEHLSETISSLSLSSLLMPGSLVPPLAKKFNSTGSLEQGNVLARNKNGRHLSSTDEHQCISNIRTKEGDEGDGEEEIAGLGAKSSSQTMDTSSRKNR